MSTLKPWGHLQPDYPFRVSGFPLPWPQPRTPFQLLGEFSTLPMAQDLKSVPWGLQFLSWWCCSVGIQLPRISQWCLEIVTLQKNLACNILSFSRHGLWPVCRGQEFLNRIHETCATRWPTKWSLLQSAASLVWYLTLCWVIMEFFSFRLLII